MTTGDYYKTNLFFKQADNLRPQDSSFQIAVFPKPFIAILNLAHLFLQKDRQKSNKLNSFPQQFGVLSAQYCASHSVSVKGASPAAAWYFYFNDS